MQEVVILSAVRTAIGRRKGGLAGLHPADLLGTVQRAAVERAGIDPKDVGQIVGGCVSQVGEQSFNIACPSPPYSVRDRTDAW
jgi:acetyl-CoA C-acetyltransferase